MKKSNFKVLHSNQKLAICLLCAHKPLVDSATAFLNRKHGQMENIGRYQIFGLSRTGKVMAPSQSADDAIIVIIMMVNVTIMMN